MYPRKFLQLQTGFLMPMALFIVLGLGVLALSISRLTSSGFSAAVQEGVSIQAFYAAESGAQYAMNQLMFDVNDRSVGDINCASLSGSNLNFNVDGLDGCSAEITCSVSNDSADTTSFYDIFVSANCGGGDLTAERTIAVKAVLQ